MTEDNKEVLLEKVAKKKMPSLYRAIKELNGGIVARDLSSLSRYNVTKKDIMVAIQTKDIAKLRQFSQYFFHASGEYRRLVEYFSKMLTFDFIVVPMKSKKASDSPAKTAKIDKSYDLIISYINNSYIQQTSRTIALSVIKDGAFYGYERELDEKYVLQQLPAERCRTRSLIDGCYTVEFDFAFFDLYRTEEERKAALASFPPEFAKMDSAYLSDKKGQRWQMLDPTFARAHMLSDEVPFLSSIFIDLIKLDDYKEMDEQRAQQQIEEVIIQKIPTDEDHQITMEIDEIETLHQNAKLMIGSSTRRVLTTPAEVDTLSFRNPISSVQDDVEKATKMIYSSAGTPMILFSSGSTGSSVGLESAIKIDEAVMFELLDQFERWYDNRLNGLNTNKNVSYKIVFPHLSIFNKKEMVTEFKDAASAGLPTKVLWMASLGLSQDYMNAMIDYENESLDLPNRMIPVSSSHTQGNENTGRPESDKPLSEEGQKTKDQRKNDNRA